MTPVSGLLLMVPLSLATHTAAGEAPRSGYEFLTPETRAMQDDAFENPGMASVEAGEALFAKAGKNGKRCADCHTEGDSMLKPGEIARYPKFSSATVKPVTLQGAIHNCWTQHLGNPKKPYDSAPLLALETYVRHLAQGMPVNVDVSGPMQPFYEKGKTLYYTRFGQIDLACNQCHDDYDGQYLRGQLLSQGQTNGFPLYRLAKGRITGLHTRMKQCFTKFRAEPFPLGSDELINLEVYLAERSNGLAIETPAVRF